MTNLAYHQRFTNFLFVTFIATIQLTPTTTTAATTTTNNNNNINLSPAPILAAGGLLSSLTSPLFIEPNQLYHQIQLANNNTANNYPQAGAANKTTVSQLLRQLQLKQANQRGGPANGNFSLSSSQQQQPLARLPTTKPTNFSLQAVRKRWRQMELTMGDNLGNLALKLKLALDELTATQRGAASISPGCRWALNELAEGLASQKLWASQTIDASARLPSGLLEGTLTELGHFDQCLGLSYETPGAAQRQMPSQVVATPTTTTTGQYCSIQIKPPLIPRVRLHTICQKLPTLLASGTTNGSSTTNLNYTQTLGQLLSQNSQHFYYAGLRLGICTPSRCQKSDVQLLLTAYLAKFDLLGQVKSCQVLGDERGGGAGSGAEFRLDFVQQCIVWALACLVSLVALGTIVDLVAASKSALVLPCKGTMDSGQPVATGTDSGSSLSGSDQHLSGCSCVDINRMAPNGKRWLYQVHRSLPGICQLHQAPGLQRNPLAATMDQATGAQAGDPASNGLENHILLGGQFSALHSPSRQDFDECHLDLNIHGNQGAPEMEQEVDDDDDDEQEEEEEAWIAQLERNQAAAAASSSSSDALGNKAHQGRKMKRKQQKQLYRKPRSGLRLFMGELLICFSLRTNLRLICRHVAGDSDGSKQQPVKCKSNVEQNCSGGSKHQDKTNELVNIKVIHGLRTITMIWIIFGHTIGLVNPEMMNNLFAVAQLSCSSRLLQALLNATLAVNTFFMISGLVTVVSLARKCDSANRLLGGPNSHATQQHGSSSPAAMVSGGGGGDEDLESSSLGSLSSLGSSMGSSNRCISGGAALSTGGGGQRQNRKRQKAAAGRKKGAASRKSISNTSGSRSRSRSRNGNGNGNGKSTSARSIGWPADFQPLGWLAMRYLRLTPAYAATIGLSILMPLAGSGPFWQESAGQLGPVCRENWWLNLIYANNFINTDKLCLIHSWYLSNDWQFFLVTIVLLTVGYKSRKLALLLMASLLFGSSAATFALTVANDFPPTIVSTSPAVAERWLFIHSLYYKPWPHLPSYLVGLLTGYLLLVRDRIKLSGSSRACAWLIFTILALALLNSIYPWNMGLQVEPLLTGLHSATFRTLWATCCAWLVFALATQPKASLAKLLGWHGFQVSSRLTYCVYLVHPLIIYYHFGTLRERMDSSVYGQLHRFIATLGLSYLFALLLSLLVESPSIQLQRLILITLGRRRRRLSSASESGNGSGGKGAQCGSRDRNCSTCSAGTNDSWIGTSSFGEQSSGGGSNLALVSDQSYPNRSKRSSQQQIAGYLPNGEAYHKGDPMGAVPSAWTTAMQNTSNTPGTPAMDVDFQRKLAQAIGRGFRIRSKLANGPMRPPVVMAAAAATPMETATVGVDTQVKRRLSAASVAVPVAPIGCGVAIEKRAAGNDVVTTMASQHQRSTAIRPSNFQQVDPQKTPKRVEFSTFFLGHGTTNSNPNNHQNCVDQSQQIAIAAANYQRRRSHDLNLMARQQNHHHHIYPATIVPPPPPPQPINGALKQKQQQQQQVADLGEIMLMKRHEPAALITRSQNQLDQFNPRERV